MALPRTITADEVSAWLQSPRNKFPDQDLCALVAERLTRMRWPSDPPAVDTTVAPELEDDDEFWDFRSTAEALIILQNSLPKMAAFFEGQQRFPETRAAYPALMALQDILKTVSPFMLYPFGKYDRQVGTKRPKKWHIAAISIANWIAAGIKPPIGQARSLDRTSVAVRVIRRALERMGYSGNDLPPSDAALSHYLIRWRDRCGIEGF